MNTISFSLILVACSLPFLAGAQGLRLREAVKPAADSTQAVVRVHSVQAAVLLKPAPFRIDHYKSLGIACKAEYRLEKATGLPLRIRLGSLQQTDYLESKPNTQKPER